MRAYAIKRGMDYVINEPNTDAGTRTDFNDGQDVSTTDKQKMESDEGNETLTNPKPLETGNK